MRKTKARGVQCFRDFDGIGSGGMYRQCARSADNFQEQLKMIREMNDIFLYPEDPEFIRERYRAMSRKELRKIASSPCPYACGTYERSIVYRLRCVFGCENKEISIFNPLDATESSLGTPLNRKIVEPADTEEEKEVFSALMWEEDDYGTD